MIVYSVLPADNFELCHPVGETFDFLKSLLNGESRLGTWKAPRMDLIHADEGRRLKASDSPWFGPDALIFRPKAVEALGPLLRANGELLPLLCPEADLLIFNCTNVLDALDEEASTILRFESGKIMWIKKPVFRKDVVQGIDIFKITSTKVSETFVGERFVQQWKSMGLKGLEFKQVWSDGAERTVESRPDESVAEDRPLILMEEMNMTETGNAKELTEKFRKIGAPDPEGWARSEVEEGIPQLARYLFLRQAWRSVLSEDNSHWIENYIRAAESKPDEPFAGVGHALKRLRTLGAVDQDLTDVVRGMQVELLFQLCYLLEDPGVVEPEVADVQWALVQTDEAGNVLGTLTGLHESVLGMDPTEREMRPKPGAAGGQDESR